MKTRRTILLLFCLIASCGLFAQSRSIVVKSLPDVGQSAFYPEYPLASTDADFIGLNAYCEDLSENYSLYYSLKYGEEWNAWIEMAPFREGASENRRVFEAEAIVPGPRAIRFSASRTLNRQAHFRLFYPTHSLIVEKEENPQSPLSACSCANPDICFRNCWCPSGNCPKDETPSYTTPDHIILHHSAGFNNSSDYKAVVAYYWDFHTQSNGWDDIGYNWLIDPNGVVYEGRGSRLLGAHFSCMNTGTEGICLIGDFMNQTPTQAAMDALNSLLSWRMCDLNLDPRQTTYHASSQLSLPVISSHRDGNSSPAPGSCASGTECPGDQFYPMLGQLRSRVSGQECLALSIQDLNGSAGAMISANPCENFKLKLNQGNHRIEVRNTMGQVVYAEYQILSTDESILITAPVPAGMYLVSIDGGSSEKSYKWIKP